MAAYADLVGLADQARAIAESGVLSPEAVRTTLSALLGAGHGATVRFDPVTNSVQVLVPHP